MPSRWQPGQLLFVGFEGTALPRELTELIEQGRVGGVILFTRNLRDSHQTRRLIEEIRAAEPAGVPVAIAIDQEGGRVQRLRDPWTEWPPMRHVARRGQADVTAQVATAIALELHDLGIDLDFAPVVDVDTNPDNPVIGDRSFGATPDVVGEHGAAFIQAMQGAGVAACAKHFPGHGDTQTDSHLELPILRHDLDRLREVELAPFARAHVAGVAAIMSAHVVFEAIDRKRPATLSPDVMALLREEIGFDRLVLSDDLEMKAVADHYRPAQIVDGALEAGVDVLLACRDLSLARELLGHLERAPDGRVERPLERMLAFKTAFAAGRRPQAESDGPPYPRHRELAERIADDVE